MEDHQLSPRYSLWRSARLSHAQVQIDWLRISGEMYGATTTVLKELEKTDESIDSVESSRLSPSPVTKRLVAEQSELGDRESMNTNSYSETNFTRISSRVNSRVTETVLWMLVFCSFRRQVGPSSGVRSHPRRKHRQIWCRPSVPIKAPSKVERKDEVFLHGCESGVWKSRFKRIA